MNESKNELTVSNDEILSLKDYIHQKNTAVLTVIFTDIKGFTQITEEKGEQIASELRKKHDEILVQIIQQDQAGLVIKFIGDAVMAVFSEPSVAVERALMIQQKLAEFNVDNPDLDDIIVRIGMHMGQVAVDDNIEVDVFGRHVNRASRIESLANGGQIYLGFSVFDSAKGWLKNQKHLIWQSHGYYFVKGIKEPIEIYEVIDSKIGQPKPPLHGRKKRSVPGVFATLSLIVLTAAITAGIFFYQQTEVWFLNFYPQQMVLDHQTRIVLTGEKKDEARLVKDPISAGKHIVHYAITDALRYYAEIDIQYGNNNLKPKFKELRLPTLNNRLSLTEERNEATRNRSVNYFLYADNGKKTEYQADLELTLSNQVDEQDKDLSHDQLSGVIKINDQLIKWGPVEQEHRFSAKRSTRVQPVLIYEDEYHAYYYQYYVYKTTFNVTLTAKFKPVNFKK